jgi:hypothetical protein
VELRQRAKLISKVQKLFVRVEGQHGVLEQE